MDYKVLELLNSLYNTVEINENTFNEKNDKILYYTFDKNIINNYVNKNNIYKSNYEILILYNKSYFCLRLNSINTEDKIKRVLIEIKYCMICYNKKSNNIFRICPSCSNNMCNECVKQIITCSCPFCRTQWEINI